MIAVHMTPKNQNNQGLPTKSTYFQNLSYAERLLSLSIWILCYSSSSHENVSVSDNTYYFRMIHKRITYRLLYKSDA
jgi:hypothetical protein